MECKCGKSGNPRTCRTGTTREISPALQVFVLVIVIRAPELLNVMLLLKSVSREEKVSSEGGTKFAVRKNVKKPIRQADHEAR